MKIPDFLKPENRGPTKLQLLIIEYEKRFGRTWSIAGTYFNDDDLERIFQTCLDENRTFYDVAEMDMDEDYSNIDI